MTVVADVIVNEPAAPDALLRVDGLTKVYGDRTAVDHVTFDLPRGRSLAVVGESGSGKSTLAKMIVGLEAPTSGSIWACGADRSTPATRSQERRTRGRQVQIVFQDPYSSLDRRQSGAQALDEVLRLHHDYDADYRRARVTELAALVGLDERQMSVRPKALSGGQRQRIAIARALAAEPQLIILDESVAALDVSIQAQVLNVLMDVRDATGVAYVLISHDLAVVRQITDDTIVMQNGAIVERGTTESVLDSPEQDYTRQLRASVPEPGWTPTRRTTRSTP